MIQGLEKLTEEQKEVLFERNRRHQNAVWDDCKDGITIVKVWIEDEIVCARLKKGEWYHYTNDWTIVNSLDTNKCKYFYTS